MLLSFAGFARKGLVAAAALLALTLAALTAHAVGGPDGDRGAGFDYNQFFMPSLGASNERYGDNFGVSGGWSDRLYRHPRYWVIVGAGGSPTGDGFVMQRLTQIQFGDVRATSAVGGMTLLGLGTVDNLTHPLVTSSATAIGNVSQISLCLSATCVEDVADTAQEDGDESNAGDKPQLTVTSVVDGSDGDLTPETEIIDTRNGGGTEEGESAEAVEQDAEAGLAETDPVDDAGATIEVKLVRLPSFGAGIGPEDWWFPGMGAANLIVKPEVLLLSRVLVNRDQLLIGNVTATASVDPIEIGEAEAAALEALAPDTPAIVVDAVALGNVASIESDVAGLVKDRQIVIGSANGSVEMAGLFGEPKNQGSGSMSSALLAMMMGGGFEKAEITAEASVDQVAAAFSDVNATALANVHTINGSSVTDPNGLIQTDLVQFVYADQHAEAKIGPANIASGIDLSAVATAIANVSSVSSFD